MCLIVSKKLTKEFSNKSNHPDHYIFFKNFIIHKHFIETPYQNTKICLTHKEILADGDLDIEINENPDIDLITINGGCIHAYTDFSYASKQHEQDFSYNIEYLTSKINVKPNDIISFGYKEVCFFKYIIPIESLDKINKIQSKLLI